MVDQAQIIAFVRGQAEANYNGPYGWSVIVECFEDEEILEAFAAPSMDEVERKLLSFVDAKSEQYRAARNY